MRQAGIALVVAALIVGLVAVADLRRHREKHGWGRAVFGLAVGVVGTAVLIAMVLSSRR